MSFRSGLVNRNKKTCINNINKKHKINKISYKNSFFKINHSSLKELRHKKYFFNFIIWLIIKIWVILDSAFPGALPNIRIYEKKYFIPFIELPKQSRNFEWMLGISQKFSFFFQSKYWWFRKKCSRKQRLTPPPSSCCFLCLSLLDFQ